MVIEILPFINQLTLFFSDDKKHAIEISGVWRFDDFISLTNFLKNFKDLSLHSVILALDSELAATDYFYQKLQRKDSNKNIDEQELESLVSQIVGRLFHIDSRSGFYLEQVQMRGLNIDGHRVVNPIGLSGREIEFYLSKTLAKNIFINELKKVLSADKLLLVGEAGCFWSHILSQIQSQRHQSFILAPIFYESAPVFLFNNGYISRIKTLKWGEKNLISVLFGNLAVNQKIAREIISVFCREEISLALSKKISSFWKNEFKTLSKNLEDLAVKEKAASIYLLPLFDFPPNQLRFNKRFNFQIINDSFISQKLGLELKFNLSNGQRPVSSFATAAILLELNSVPVNNLMNKAASRRLRWHEM